MNILLTALISAVPMVLVGALFGVLFNKYDIFVSSKDHGKIVEKWMVGCYLAAFFAILCAQLVR